MTTLEQLLHRALTWHNDEERIRKAEMVSKLLFFTHVPIWKAQGVQVKRGLLINPAKGWVTMTIRAQSIEEPSRVCQAQVYFTRRDDHTFVPSLVCNRELKVEPFSVVTSEILTTLVEQMVEKCRPSVPA